jgi:hypothetical protein
MQLRGPCNPADRAGHAVLFARRRRYSTAYWPCADVVTLPAPAGTFEPMRIRNEKARGDVVEQLAVIRRVHVQGSGSFSFMFVLFVYSCGLPVFVTMQFGFTASVPPLFQFCT